MGIEDFETIRLLGTGNYGSVFLVRNRATNVEYALKKIPLGRPDEALAAQQESVILKSIRHQNVIAFKDSFVHKDSLCMVAEYCGEGDLYSRIAAQAKLGTPFSEGQIMDWFIQIAMGLEAVHTQHVLHRDLKTQNVFLAKGVAKLGDFGISKVLEGTEDFTTTVTGSPYYMAPEVCTNQPYTFKSDIWSLGCVLYELCTLKHAFSAASLLSLVVQIVKGSYPPISKTAFDPRLCELVNALLVADASKRPSVRDILRSEFVVEWMGRLRDGFVRSLGRSLPRSLSRSRSGAEGAGHVLEGTARSKEAIRARKQAAADARAAELSEAVRGAMADAPTTAARKAAMLEGSHKVYYGGGGAVPNMPTLARDPVRLVPAVGTGTVAAMGATAGLLSSEDWAALEAAEARAIHARASVVSRLFAPGANSSESDGGEMAMASTSTFLAATQPHAWDDMPAAAAARSAVASSFVPRVADGPRPAPLVVHTSRRSLGSEAELELTPGRLSYDDTPVGTGPTGTPSIEAARRTSLTGNRREAAYPQGSAKLMSGPPVASRGEPEPDADDFVRFGTMATGGLSLLPAEDEYESDFEEESPPLGSSPGAVEDAAEAGGFDGSGTWRPDAETRALAVMAQNLKAQILSASQAPDAASQVPDIPVERVVRVDLLNRRRLESLQDACRAELGPAFEDVYAYLVAARLRSAQEVMGAAESEETALERIAGRHLIAACTRVDQLVTQELLWGPERHLR